MFCVYVLYSRSFDCIYIGQTDNLVFRLKRHNEGKVRSTKAYAPWELISTEEYATRSEAMRRERALKSHQGRKYIREILLNGRVRQLPD